MTDRKDIEKLVASAYRDIHPSAAVEEEVRENLPTERARRRTIGPAVLSLLIVAALALVAILALDRIRSGDAPGFAGEGAGSEPELPLVARPPSGVVQRKTDWIRVRLRDDGRILIPPGVPGGTWRQVSLDGLAEHLAKEASAFDGRERKEQRSGYDVLATGAKASRLRVVLQLDRDVPWMHVQLLLFICAERYMPKIAFAVQGSDGREFWLDATLPTDRGVGQPPRYEIMVSIQLLARLERGARPGAMPAGVRYRFGDREAEELASVARWLAVAKLAATQPKVPIRGEIRATGTTPFHHIAKLLAEFRRSGFAQVDFFGTQVPTPEMRAAVALPPPLPSRPELRDPRVPQEVPMLVYRLEEGKLAEVNRALEIVRRRLRVAGFANLEVELRGENLVIERPDEESKVQEVRDLVERKGASLEFHITVEPGAPNYDHYWQRLERALEGGARFEDVRDILPEDRAKDDRFARRYPLGLRWYRLSPKASELGNYPAHRLPGAGQPYVLCANDDHGITERSLRRVVHRRNTVSLSGHWLVAFEVKEPYQEGMARLTGREGEYLAIVLDGEVHAAPVLRSTLSRNGEISGSYTEEEARRLAALLDSEPLPVRFALVKRRR